MAHIDLMIAGAQKAGTTSLKNYLGTHPSLITHELTEFAFFVHDDEYKAGFERALKLYFPNDDLLEGKRIIAKNAGLYSKEAALERLYLHNPACIVVLIIRNPVDRAYSSYNMEWESGWFTKPWDGITESLENYKNGEKDQMFRLFIELGLYAEQLKKIYTFFPANQVEVIRFEELKVNPKSVCQRLFKKLGVDESVIVDTSTIYNPTKKVRSKDMGRFLIWLMQNDNPLKKISKKILPQAAFLRIREWLFNVNSAEVIATPPIMSPVIKKELMEFFKPYNKELERMTGLNLGEWNQ